MVGRAFKSVRFMAAERGEDELALVQPDAAFSVGPLDMTSLAHDYLVRVLAFDAGLSFDAAPQAAPEVVVTRVQPSPLAGSEVVRFAQAHAKIPIFGSHMLVELRGDGSLVGVDAELAAVQGVSPEPTIDAAQALANVAAQAGVDAASVTLAEPATLTFAHDDAAGRWRLAWLLRDVPLTPVDRVHGRGCGHGGSPRLRTGARNYLVDAHDGEVFLDYSSAPRARAAEPGVLPVECHGPDEAGVRQTFYGVAVDGGFEMRDPLRRTQTLDIAGGDISAARIPLPKAPIRSEAAEFSPAHRAAVSAHVNVGRVLDFYRSVLQRDSVDDRGMEIVSVVGCISSDDETPPSWGNAIWWKNRMWYGQIPGADGGTRSFSGFLDVIAHELTHGVIEHTADLIYKGESGALNESIADIFGIIIANWYEQGETSDPGTWRWEFGVGLGEPGLPIRDLSDPRRTRDPDHMKDYLRTRADEGGVHSNSNIHNKAAYHLITAVDGAGARVFTPREAAVLYYLTLQRLPQRAGFVRTLRGLCDVATTYYAGDAAQRERKLAAIEGAYARVGVTLGE